MHFNLFLRGAIHFFNQPFCLLAYFWYNMAISEHICVQTLQRIYQDLVGYCLVSLAQAALGLLSLVSFSCSF